MYARHIIGKPVDMPTTYTLEYSTDKHNSPLNLCNKSHGRGVFLPSEHSVVSPSYLVYLVAYEFIFKLIESLDAVPLCISYSSHVVAAQ